MNLRENVSLKDYSTMRLGGTARYVTDATSKEELREAVAWAKDQKLPVRMIGAGSNIIWKDQGYPGLLLINKLLGIKEVNADAAAVWLEVGAGENWDAFVANTVERGLSGVECLSLVPGTVGGTPVQNVGAYGQEVASVIVSLEAYDTETNKMVTLANAECGFGYRTSRFKTTDQERFFITHILFKLSKAAPKQPFYEGLQKYLDTNHITDYSAASLRQAVITIRQGKLPDPAKVANNGSFFANPIISNDEFAALKAKFPDIVAWEMDNGQVKLAAAWLLEQAGFKDYHDPVTGMATWPNQPLVLVNERADSTAQLVAFRDRIIDTVEKRFDVRLEQEPELLP